MGVIAFISVAEWLWISYGAGKFGENIRRKQERDERLRKAETNAYHLGVALLDDDRATPGFPGSLQVRDGRIIDA